MSSSSEFAESWAISFSRCGFMDRARGEWRDDSDIDLLVLLKDDVASYDMDVIQAAVDVNLAHGRYPLSVRTRDLEWLRGRREVGSFFVGEVDRDKVALYGREF